MHEILQEYFLPDWNRFCSSDTDCCMEEGVNLRGHRMRFSAFNTGLCGDETGVRLQGRRCLSVGYELTKCHIISFFFVPPSITAFNSFWEGGFASPLLGQSLFGLFVCEICSKCCNPNY